MSELMQQVRDVPNWLNFYGASRQGYQPVGADRSWPQVEVYVSSPYPPSSPNPDQEATTTSRMASRRYLKLLLPVVLVLLLVYTATPAVDWLHSPSVISSFHNRLSTPSSTRVGPRQHPYLYYGHGCNATELIRAVKDAKIRPDGRSREEYAAPKGMDDDHFSLADFEWSYDFEGCPTPHLFTPAETCDLLSAFGGIRMHGDSLLRQFSQGVFLLLTDSFSGLVESGAEKECYGNGVFTEGMYCKFHEVFDTRDMKTVCDEDPFMQYDQVWRWTSQKGNPSPIPADYNTSHPLIDTYNTFVSSLPARRQQYSPILVHSTGIHYKFDTEPTINAHILPFLRNVSSAIPQPLKFWSGNPAPGANKPKAWLETQGAAPTMRYNEEINDILDELSPGELSMGAWKQMEWYNSTDGALSYDGTHYSYQVAMERAQVFLNLLDIVWGEIVAAGGLVEDGEQIAE